MTATDPTQPVTNKRQEQQKAKKQAKKQRQKAKKAEQKRNEQTANDNVPPPKTGTSSDAFVLSHDYPASSAIDDVDVDIDSSAKQADFLATLENPLAELLEDDGARISPWTKSQLHGDPATLNNVEIIEQQVDGMVHENERGPVPWSTTKKRLRTV